MTNLWYAFLITFIAGLATVIGGLIVIFIKKNDNVIISSLAFAAGVMMTVSLFDLIPESINMFSNIYKIVPMILIILIFINIGIILSLYVDKKVKITDNKIYRVGIISLLAMILHNIPEGMATFITTNTNIKLGLALSSSIAAHNIPEGIIIAFPIFYATGSRRKAIIYTLIAGMSELLGGIISFIFLKPFINDFLMGSLYSIIAGIMIFISFNELLPTSLSFKNKKITYISFIIGMIIMIISHFIFN